MRLRSLTLAMGFMVVDVSSMENSTVSTAPRVKGTLVKRAVRCYDLKTNWGIGAISLAPPEPDKEENNMQVTRKIYVCKDCEFMYCDEPVSSCDCMGTSGFIEGVAKYQVKKERISGCVITRDGVKYHCRWKKGFKNHCLSLIDEWWEGSRYAMTGPAEVVLDPKDFTI